MADPYASHLPALRMLLGTMKPSRVVEFGGGYHSTPAILAAPSVTALVTVEANPVWQTRLATALRREVVTGRLTLTEEPVADLDEADLVLIDDGEGVLDRLDTIDLVLGHPDHPPVMIHDSDVPAYSARIESYGLSGYTFPTAPATTVVWR